MAAVMNACKLALHTTELFMKVIDLLVLEAHHRKHFLHCLRCNAPDSAHQHTGIGPTKTNKTNRQA